jgi:hypothetical protein
MRAEEELRDYQMATISERAMGRPDPAEIPERERPLSELYRIAGDAWVEAKFKRDKIKGLKTTMLERQKRDLIEEARQAGTRMTNAEAERIIEMSTEWEQYIIGLAEAERDTESAWIKCQEIEMRFGEWQSQEANARKEQRISRQSV